MTTLYVEVDGTKNAVAFSQIAKMLTAKDASALLDDLSESLIIPVNFLDGRKAVISQSNLPVPVSVQKYKYFDLSLTTSVPVSARMFILADNEEDAKNKMQEMIAKGTISLEDIPDLEESIDAEFQLWIEQCDEDDWQLLSITETP